MQLLVYLYFRESALRNGSILRILARLSQDWRNPGIVPHRPISSSFVTSWATRGQRLGEVAECKAQHRRCVGRAELSRASTEILSTLQNWAGLSQSRRIASFIWYQLISSSVATSWANRRQCLGEVADGCASKVLGTGVQIRLGLLHQLPANVEKLAQPSGEIGFHLLPAMTTNFQVLPALWQPAVNRSN